ncbi:MAG: hypothetical protein MJ138_07300 [Kiritimatiellae bacterium]|nr:hypothetical protein [Kiritimatiellia bacterium]
MKKILIGMMLAAAGCATTDVATPAAPAPEKPAAVEAAKPEAPKPAEAKKPETPKPEAPKPAAEAKKPEPPKPVEAKKPEPPKDQKIMDIRPDASAKTGATSVEWEKKNDAALKATVNDAKIKELLQGGEPAAKALLAEVKPNFQTDPMKACLIAGTSQCVMKPGFEPARATWTKALLNAAAAAKTPDATCYFLDQLRWCGTADQADAVLKLAAAQPDGEVKKFAKMVASEISGEQQKLFMK